MTRTRRGVWILLAAVDCGGAEASTAGPATTPGSADVGGEPKCPVAFTLENTAEAVSDCQGKVSGEAISAPDQPAAVCFNRAARSYKCTAPKSFAEICAPNSLDHITIDEVTCQSPPTPKLADLRLEAQYIALLPQTNDPDARRYRLEMSSGIRYAFFTYGFGVALGLRSAFRQYLGPNGVPLATGSGPQFDFDLLLDVGSLNFRFGDAVELSLIGFSLGWRFDPSSPYSPRDVVWAPEFTLPAVRLFPWRDTYLLAAVMTKYEPPGQVTYTAFATLAGPDPRWYWQTGIGVGHDF
jgi:hypothetical protein